MSILIGITGGIGSGKSTLVDHLSGLGYKVFKSDDEAKKLFNEAKIIEAIKNDLGKHLVINNTVDKKTLANEVFKDEQKLKKLNKIIHTQLKIVFETWVNQNASSQFLFKEAAILFETGAHKDLNYNILITAPKEVRINRVINRDGITRKQVLERIKNQWSETQKRALADLVIVNTDLENAKLKLLDFLKKLENTQKNI